MGVFHKETSHGLRSEYSKSAITALIKAHGVLVEKRERKRQLGRPRRRLENNITIEFQEI
jgi:hypothetical protein